MTEISVVVPVYGCNECLWALHGRLAATLDALTSDWEIVFVDDRSTDGAWATLERIAAFDGRVRAYRLSRNFGQHAAITAGLTQSRGRWVVVMDCDLEEPPEEIPRLYAKAQEGYDVVHGVRVARRHSLFRRAASRVYRFLVLESDRHSEYSTLSMVSRRVVNAFLTLKDKDREYLLVLDWLGFEQATVEFRHGERPSGQSSYTLRSLVRVALDGMFFRTTVLLRVIVAIGFLLSLAGLLVAALLVVEYFTSGAPEGYTSLAVLLLVLSGFIIVSVGVVGLYVGRIFEQVKDRPLFVIQDEALGQALPEQPELERSEASG